MSALAATTVHRSGAGRITVANRTPANAERLAGAVGGRAVPLADLPAALADADLVISCTGAVGHVIDRRGAAPPAAPPRAPPPYARPGAPPRGGPAGAAGGGRARAG